MTNRMSSNLLRCVAVAAAMAWGSPALAGACGSGWSEPFVPDRFYIAATQDAGDRRGSGRPSRASERRGRPRQYRVSFTPACEQHDACYGRRGSRKSSCDTQFYRAMLSACRDAIPSQARSAQLRCINIAGSYNDVLRGQRLRSVVIGDSAWDLRLMPGAACRAYQRAQGPLKSRGGRRQKFPDCD